MVEGEIKMSALENIQTKVKEIRGNIKTRVGTARDKIQLGQGLGIIPRNSPPAALERLRTRMENIRGTRVPLGQPMNIDPSPPERKKFEVDLLTIPKTATEKPISAVNKKLYV